MHDWIRPDWPAPATVHALSTTRSGGVSQGPWESLNLGDHVGDDPVAVKDNRRLLLESAELPSEPLWLAQIHGCGVANAVSDQPGCEADASISAQAGRVCAVMTADCLPVIFTNTQGDRVAAAHAGWRGLAGGVLEETVKRLDENPANILAWLGPAIGPEAFEVGDEVRAAFMEKHAVSEDAFTANGPGHWLADIYRLARNHLEAVGVTKIFGGGFCTFTENERFFSYRRNSVTGRMATLVWME